MIIDNLSNDGKFKTVKIVYVNLKIEILICLINWENVEELFKNVLSLIMNPTK